MNRTFLSDNIGVNGAGHLTFAGRDTCDLAQQYSTPLYLMDEERVRKNCRLYLDAMKRFFPEGSLPLFASKACAFKAIYRILSEEGLGTDVVSCGEIHTAKEAGFDMSLAYFHGSNKTDADIRFAIESGVGYFVVDNADELLALEKEASLRGITQNVLLRVTPGIDPHTYEAVNTGMVDSKFGAAIETGQASALAELALKQPHLDIKGFHCHVGSQVFAEDVFERAAAVMLTFMTQIKNEFGYEAEQLDLGGGYGVRYVDTDPAIDIASKIGDVAKVIRETCEALSLRIPKILLEPGRSIVADAGMTLYTAGSVKRIPGYKSYVSVDGGMTDNPRFALYKSKYSCYAASRMNEPFDAEYTIAGRCCESGDIIQEHVAMPSSVSRGDIIAVCTTGAYNYSMASNYNRIPRPPVLMLSASGERIVVKRESFADVASLDE